VLESRHLVSLFLGVVLLCGVFFTLGYVMGHNQYGGPVHAADALDGATAPVRPSVKPKPVDTPPATEPAAANNEWDFYAKKGNDNSMAPAATKPSAAASAPAKSVAARPANGAPATPVPVARTIPASARFQAPKLGKGEVVLQIAALTHESDALTMADALQQKHFPSFVVTPTTDNFYRVQVGPYPDEKTANASKAALDHAGFIAIIKR
jgi:DedD protein